MDSTNITEITYPATAQVIPRAEGRYATTADVRELLNQAANAYPELNKIMDAANRLIVHLETLRHEAILPLGLGDPEGAKRILKQAAMVEVRYA